MNRYNDVLVQLCLLCCLEMETFTEKVYWLSDSGDMYIKPSMNERSERLREISDVKVFAYDWLGDTLYWVSRRPSTVVRTENQRVPEMKSYCRNC